MASWPHPWQVETFAPQIQVVESRTRNVPLTLMCNRRRNDSPTEQTERCQLAAERVEHRFVNVTSHVLSFEGSVGAIGVCSCGELISAEGYRTHEVTKELRDAWKTHVHGLLTDDSA